MDTAELILWGIPALCFLFIIWLVVSKINEYKNDSAFSRACDDYIQKNNITCTRDLSFLGSDNRCRFIADENEKAIYIYSQATGDHFTRIPYRAIMGVQINQQNVDTETIGAALLSGRSGPIPRTTFVENYRVVISVRDIQNPRIILPLITNSRTRFESDEYRRAVGFAEEMQAIIRVIQSERF